MSDEKGWEKRNRSTRPKRLTVELALAAPLAGGNRPRNGPGEREKRASLTEKRTYLYYRTALHCAGRAVLVLGGVLWALGHNPRPIKEEKIEPRDSRTTTGYAQPVQTNRLGGSATKIDVEMGGD